MRGGRTGVAALPPRAPAATATMVIVTVAGSSLVWSMLTLSSSTPSWPSM